MGWYVLVCLVTVVAIQSSFAADHDRGADSAEPPSMEPAGRPTDHQVLRWSQTMFWSMVLLLVLAASATAIVVFSRRFKAYLTRDRPPATPSEDVWSMHRLPPEFEDDGGRGSDAGDADGRRHYPPSGPDQGPPDGPSDG